MVPYCGRLVLLWASRRRDKLHPRALALQEKAIYQSREARSEWLLASDHASDFDAARPQLW